MEMYQRKDLYGNKVREIFALASSCTETAFQDTVAASSASQLFSSALKALKSLPRDHQQFYLSKDIGSQMEATD